LDKIRQSASMMRTIKGWSPEQEKDYLGTQQSKLVFERATTLARTDPATAQKVLDDAVKSGYISGEESGRAQEFVRQKRNHITSRIEADALLAGDGDHFSVGNVPVGDAREAIASVESSGNYEAVHTVVKKGQYAGQRALGRYGIMPGNLPSWLKEAGMPSMTPEEFVKDHSAQDKLFNFKFGQLMREHGSAGRAAMVWFTGSPEPKPNANDGLTSAPDYLKRFNAALGQNASPERRYEVAKKRAQELSPDDPEFEFQFTNRVEAAHRTQTNAYKEELRQNIDVIESAIVPAKDGKLITSVDDVADPEVHKAWDWLQMHDPKRIRQYNELFARNAKGDYTATEENQAEYHQWLGRLTDPTMSDAEREKAMNADYATMHMPAANRDRLNQIRNKLIAGHVKDPNVAHAMQVLEPRLVEAGITKKDDEENYYLLKGILHDAMQNEIARAKRPLKDEEIIQMGNRLLREQVIKKGWFLDTKGPTFKAEVPEQMKNIIIERYSNKYGDTPSEQTIRRIWAVKLYNTLYSKGASDAAQH